MNRARFLIFGILVFLSSCKMVSKKPKTDVGAFNWGVSMNDVAAKNGPPAQVEGGRLIYRNQPIMGIPTVTGYEFVKNRLARTIYISNTAIIPADTVKSAVLNISDSLSKAYGPSKDEPQPDGNTVQRKWILPKTTILFIYKPGNNAFMLSMTSTELGSMISEPDEPVAPKDTGRGEW